MMMMMMMMMWLLLPLSLISSVWTFPLVVSPTYQTVEDDNITISWDCDTKTDLSFTNLKCRLLSEPPKVLYQMTDGAEGAESHQQFSGRVQLDKEALRGGRFRLSLSNVAAEDSGTYRCDVAANYDETMRTWEFTTSETFVLNVSQISDGDGVVSPNTATRPEGSKTTRGDQLYDYMVLATLIGALLLMVVAAVGKLLRDNPPHKGPD
ncbi:uncharacterized protein LOC114869341 isoform X2 [Betta splendens]|uniref:Uncharacterized protein LOC114869341 isoform X2 n=1 Tax=Betta splendens TaxID=158456 RepID=A0A9W2Y8E1_BETSP|nr:uncharacterized protein LOC114869341 isoform X2 [Betta splendens]